MKPQKQKTLASELGKRASGPDRPLKIGKLKLNRRRTHRHENKRPNWPDANRNFAIRLRFNECTFTSGDRLWIWIWIWIGEYEIKSSKYAEIFQRHVCTCMRGGESAFHLHPQHPRLSAPSGTKSFGLLALECQIPRRQTVVVSRRKPFRAGTSKAQATNKTSPRLTSFRYYPHQGLDWQEQRHVLPTPFALRGASCLRKYCHKHRAGPRAD